MSKGRGRSPALAPAAALHVLRRRRLRGLAAAVTVSAVGDSLSLVATLVLLYSSFHTPLAIGGAYAARGVGGLLSGLTAGAAADHLDRRRLVVRLEALRTALMAAMPFAVAATPWSLFAGVGMWSAIEAIVQPSRQAAVAAVVPAEELEAANGAILAGTTLAGGIGFGLAGVLVSALPSPAWLFELDAVTFAAAALIVFGLPALGGGQTRFDVRQDVLAALGGPAGSWLRMAAVGALVIGLGLPILLPYAYELAAGGAQAYSLLEVALLLGMVGGSFVVAAARARPAATMALGLAVTGVSAAALGATHLLVLACLWVAVSAVGNAIYVVANQTAVLRACHEAERGRAAACRFALTQVASLLGIAAGGAVASAAGAHVAYALAAIGLVAVAALPVRLGRVVLFYRRPLPA